MGFLIDTCIWVDIERGTISPADVEMYTHSDSVYISPVTIAELTFGVAITNDMHLRNKRLSALNRLKKMPIVVIDESTGDIFGALAATLLTKGKQSKHRVQDIWLASQAIQHDFFFLTKNAKDFSDIPGLNHILFGK